MGPFLLSCLDLRTVAEEYIRHIYFSHINIRSPKAFILMTREHATNLVPSPTPVLYSTSETSSFSRMLTSNVGIQRRINSGESNVSISLRGRAFSREDISGGGQDHQLVDSNIMPPRPTVPILFCIQLQTSIGSV